MISLLSLNGSVNFGSGKWTSGNGEETYDGEWKDNIWHGTGEERGGKGRELDDATRKSSFPGNQSQGSDLAREWRKRKRVA